MLVAGLVLNRRKAASLEQESNHVCAVKLINVEEGRVDFLNLLGVLGIRCFFQQLHQEPLKYRIISPWVQRRRLLQNSLIILHHWQTLVDNLLYLVLQDLCHVQQQSLVSPLVLAQAARLLSFHCFLEGFFHALREFGDAVLTVLPFWCVHEAGDLLAVHGYEHLGVGALALRNVLDSEVDLVVGWLLVFGVEVGIVNLVKVDHLAESWHNLFIIAKCGHVYGVRCL